MAGADWRAPQGDSPEQGPPSAAGQDPPSPPPNPQAFDPAALLARLWQQNLPALRARVDCLDEAAAEAAAGALSVDTRTRASDLAHKLAGSLGMFGYSRGTDLAREFEQTLEGGGQPDASVLLRLATELRSILPL